MENAHLRMGRLKFVKQRGDTVADVSVYFDRLAAEGDTFHLVSAFGGDVEIGALLGAISTGLQLHAVAADLDVRGTLGESPVVYRASLLVPGRKQPVRHLVAISQTLFQTTLGADSSARRTVLYDAAPEFLLRRLAVRFGLPVLPQWAEWFSGELERRKMITPLAGFNCSPVVVQGTQLRMLRLLSMGLRRRAITME